MILLLEGPDGAGKTTLSEKLRQHFSDNKMVHIVKHGPYKDVSPEHLCRIYFRGMSPALTFDDHVIMDRSWISEPIYGNVYRGGANRIDLPRRRMLERAALSRGGIVIHCQPTFEACAKAFESRPEEEYLDNVKQLKEVYDEYEALPLLTSLPVVHYDYERDTIDELLERIEFVYFSRQNKASGGGCFKEGNILMLCDRGPRTNVRSSAVVIPFINFNDDDGPSRMLAETLTSEGITEDKIYWINTQNYQGQPTEPDFIAKLKPSKIFALGNNAYTWAINNNVKAIKLPPPLHHMQNYPDQPYYITDADYGNFNN
jgi:thymidylate kinase